MRLSPAKRCRIWVENGLSGRPRGKLVHKQQGSRGPLTWCGAAWGEPDCRRRGQPPSAGSVRKGDPVFQGQDWSSVVPVSIGQLWTCSPGVGPGCIAQSKPGTTFTVQVYSTDPSADYDPHQIGKLLNTIKPGLRAEVAQAINRKNAPNFTFDVLPPHVQPR